MAYANSADPDQTPPDAASDLGLQCLPIRRRLTWVCTVCLCPINGTLGIIVIIMLSW